MSYVVFLFVMFVGNIPLTEESFEARVYGNKAACEAMVVEVEAKAKGTAVEAHCYEIKLK